MAAQYTFQLWFYIASQDCFFAPVIRHYRGRYHRLGSHCISIYKEYYSIYCTWKQFREKVSHIFYPFFEEEGVPPSIQKNKESYSQKQKWYRVLIRELREGCPLLTVETEENGDSKSTNDRGPSLVGSLGLSCPYRRFLCYLGCSKVGPEQNNCFLTGHYSISIQLCPSLSKLHSQPPFAHLCANFISSCWPSIQTINNWRWSAWKKLNEIQIIIHRPCMCISW